MIRFLRTRKSGVLCLLLIAIIAVVSGGSESEAPKYPTGATSYARAVTAAKNRDALEAYERRNAEITPWVEDSVPANTDNAALLYYQAFLLRPEPDETMQLRPGTEPTSQLRTYLGRCLPMIEIVEIASRIPGCTWAVWPEGHLSQRALRRQIGRSVDILLVDARTLAVDGHCRVALERCLTVRRVVQHLADDPELHFIEMAMDGLALSTINNVLGMMPPDVGLLTWFRGQVAEVPGPRLSYAKTLRAMVRTELNSIRQFPDVLRYYKDLAINEADGEQAKDDIRNLVDAQFRLRARQGLAPLIDSILRILDSEATHEQKLAQMKEIVDQKMEDNATDPVVKGIISGMNMKGQINRGYSRQIIEHEARVNATKAAVELYLVLAKTGRLPERLPEHLPKDPFTGQDFEYEITDEGFVLRCEGNEFLFQKEISLEFRVHK